MSLNANDVAMCFLHSEDSYCLSEEKRISVTFLKLIADIILEIPHQMRKCSNTMIWTSKTITNGTLTCH